MTEETKKRKSRKHKRRTHRFVRRILSLITFIVLLYIVVLLMGIFDGSKVGQFLRKYEVVNTPAEYLIEQFNIDTDFFTVPIDTQSEQIVIRVSEDDIYFNDEEVSINDLEGLLEGKNNVSFKLVDDNAKHVTYTAVEEELERLGIKFSD